MAKKVLNDHKRVGKTLVPPMMQLPNMRSVSWYEDALPEIIWIAVINERLGYKEGAYLFGEISKIIINLDIFENVLGYCSLSSHSKLSEEKKILIRNSFRKHGHLEYLKGCLRGFASIYPKQPLSYIYEESEIPTSLDVDYYLSFKDLMNKLFDKRSKESVMCSATVIYSLGMNGRLVLNEGTPLSKLPEVIHYPETELSRMIAAGVRASMNAFWGIHLNEDLSDWNKYFWNHGLSLEKCEMK